MRHRSLAVAAGLTLFCALSARAELPYPADPNRCDSSGMPLARTRLPATRLVNVSPAQVSTGSPAHSASLAVVWALQGVGDAGAARIQQPKNRVLPTVSGAAVQGQTLTASTGSWSEAPAR